MTWRGCTGVWREASTCGKEAIHVNMLALAVAPHSCRCLFVGCGVPVRVEQDEPVGTDEVEAAATGLAAQEEHKVAFGAVTEVIHLQSI